eukprot:TRINITY_DN1625_c0_g1_i1.p1 TRINITY_DN1625_c0_g1~~TRINITY_DN1625_c0_g1_i1.p1  ORF type:complete len:3164 (+),score=941.24 TRINITY_DN1625_c0_g1_i1:583-9492(+)
MDVAPCELFFSGITADSPHVERLHINNKSPIPLFYTLRLDAVSQEVAYQLTDYDSQEPVLDRELRLDQLSYQTVEVRVIPRTENVAGQDMKLYVQNLLDDTTRTVTISVGASRPGATGKRPPLSIALPEGGGNLDFGECYAGVSVLKVIDVTSESVHPLVVSFAADAPDVSRGAVSCRVKEHGYGTDAKGESSDDGDDAPAAAPDAADKPQLPTGMAETVLKPGRSERIEVFYTPDHLAQGEGHRGKGFPLERVRWRLFVRASDTAESARERARNLPAKEKKEKKADSVEDASEQRHTFSKVIQVNALVGTSRVEVRETEINFGDSVVGEKTTCQVQVVNPCDLAAKLHVDFDSRVMSLMEDARDLDVPARSERNIGFQMTPHKVNPSFRKQVTIRNYNNSRNNIIINLSSNNIPAKDHSSVAFHSTYYHASFPQAARRRHVDAEDSDAAGASTSSASAGKHSDQERRKELLPYRTGIGIDAVVTGFPALRTFKLKNVRDTDLRLSLSVSKPDWITLYRASHTPAVAARAEPDELTDLAAVAKLFEADSFLRLPERRMGEDERKQERKHVAQVQRLREALDRLIEREVLVPVRNLDLPAGVETEATIYVVIRVPTPSNRDSVAKGRGNREESIRIDVANVPGVAPREVPVKFNLVTSKIEIAQRNLNMGSVDQGEKQKRTISVSNDGEVCLLLEVVKSMDSVGGVQLGIEGSLREEKYQVAVRPFHRRELELNFAFAYPGQFHQTLTFRNVLDQLDSKTMTIKADVTKPATFEVMPAVADLGILFLASSRDVGRLDRPRARVQITNIGRGKRDFLLVPSKPNFGLTGVEIQWEYVVENVKAAAGGTKKIEDEIEKAEHKLKIYERKNKVDKAARLRRKLVDLRRALETGGTQPADDGVSSSDDEGRRERVRSADLPAVPHSCVTPLVVHGGVCTVYIAVSVAGTSPDFPHPCGTREGECELSVCETRDKEARQVCCMRITVTDDDRRTAAVTTPERQPGPPQWGAYDVWRDEDRREPSGNSSESARVLTPGRGAAGRDVRGDGVDIIDVMSPDGSPPRVAPEVPPSSPPRVTVPALPKPPDIGAEPPPQVDCTSPPRRPSTLSPGDSRSLRIEPRLLNMWNVPIGVVTERTFRVVADCAPCKFVIMPDGRRSGRVGGGEDEGPDAQVQVTPVTGEAAPEAPVTVRVRVTPTAARLQKYRWVVRNLTSSGGGDQTTTFSFCGVAPDPVVCAPSTVDFDKVYIPMQQQHGYGASHAAAAYGPGDSRPSKRQELRLKSTSATTLRLTFSSTVPGQCRIYRTLVGGSLRDPLGPESPPVSLLPGQTCTMHAALWPRMDVARAADGVCKRVRGGIIVKAVDDGGLQWRKELPFSALVGCATLKVSPMGVVDLGRRARDARKAQPRGEFKLRNTNQELPLDYSIIVSEDSAVKLTARHEGRLPPGGTEVIPFVVAPHSFGLVEETVEFRNRSSPQQTAVKRVVMLFDDDKCVETSLKPAASGEAVLQIPGVVLVQPRQRDSPTRSTSDGREERKQRGEYLPSGIVKGDGRAQLTVYNKSGAHLTLVPRTDAHGYDASGTWAPIVTVSSKDPHQSPQRPPSQVPMQPMSPRRAGPAHWTNCGAKIALKRDALCTVTVQAKHVIDSVALTPKQKRQLEEHKVVTVPFHVLLVVEHSQYPSRNSSHRHTLTQGRTVLCLAAHISYCLTQVQFTCKQLNLGKVNQGDCVPFGCELRNLSAVPVQCMVTASHNVLWGQCQAATRELCQEVESPTGAPISSPVRTATRQSSLRPLSRRAKGTPPTTPATASGTCVRLSVEGAPAGLSLAPHQILRLHASLQTSACAVADPQTSATAEAQPVPDAGTVCTASLVIANSYNAVNKQRLLVQCTLARSILSIEHPSGVSGGGRATWLNLSSAVRMQPKVGASKVKHADCKVTVRCVASLEEGKFVTARLFLEPAPALDGFVVMSLLLLATSLPVSEFTFTRDERAAGLRIRCEPAPGVRTPAPIAERLWHALLDDLHSQVSTHSTEVHHKLLDACAAPTATDGAANDGAALSYATAAHFRELGPVESQPLQIGQLHLAVPDQPKEMIEIWGTIALEDTFTVSAEGSLTLRRDDGRVSGDPGVRVFTATLNIRNLFDSNSLRLRLDGLPRGVEGAPLIASTTFEPSNPVLPPSAAIDVVVTVEVTAAAHEDQFVDPVLLLVQDTECLYSTRVLGTRLVAHVDDEVVADPDVVPTPRSHGGIPTLLSNATSSADESPTVASHMPPTPTPPTASPAALATATSSPPGTAFLKEQSDDREPQQAVALLPRSESPVSLDPGDAHQSVSDGAVSPAAHLSDSTPTDPPRAAAAEDAAAPAREEAPSSGDMSFRLHNCRAIEGDRNGGGLYVLQLPPQGVDSGDTHTKVLLENTTAAPIEVDVNVVRYGKDADWLSVSKDCIKVAPLAKAPIVFTARTSSIGHFSTYATLQRRSSDRDSKVDLATLRCRMEVFGGGSATAGFFDVVIDGRAADGHKRAPGQAHTRTIDFGEVFDGEEVVHRCVDLVNQSPHRLDFNMTHTNRRTNPQHISVDARFSLSVSSFRPFNRVTVEPNKTVRVFIWYKVSLPVRDTEASRAPLEMCSDIVLKCRLVKDAQMTLMLKSKVHFRQIVVSKEVIEFSGGSMDPQTVELFNSWRTAAMVELRSDLLTAFCLNGRSSRGPFSLAPESCEQFEVRPVMAAIEALWRRHGAREPTRGSSVEEHFTVYNRAFPKERKHIVVRHVMRGGTSWPTSAPAFSHAPFHNIADSHALLESMVVGFLRKFLRFALAAEAEAAAALAAMQPLSAVAAPDSEDDDDEDDAEHSHTGHLVGDGPGASAGPNGSEPTPPISPRRRRGGRGASGRQERQAAREAVRRCYTRLLNSDEAGSLYFELRYLTDELVYQGLNGHAGSAFEVAKLLYAGVLRRPLFHHPLLDAAQVPAVEEWRGQVRFFDSFSTGPPLGR